ncbi:hypothetical protein DFJ74DRAFT_21672 [Hyaloraphidium curvatum]|nr:hypothetical protein DFJ74DRAFT_21672 [Hyaloraphidium curvatum]
MILRLSQRAEGHRGSRVAGKRRVGKQRRASYAVRKFALLYPEYNIISFDKLDYCASLNNCRSLESLPNFSFVKGDITSVDLVLYVLQEKNVDTIIHFAAQSHVDNSFGDSFEFTKNNVVGTHVLLEAARLQNIKKMIHISTDEVYGEADSNLLEEAVLQPTNPYSASKAAAEMLVKAYSKSFNLPVIITRSNNVYGPYQYPEKVIPKFVCLLKRGKKVCLHGNGSNSRRYIFASDVADAIDTILHKGQIGEIYNIGTDFEITNLELAKTLVSKFGYADKEEQYLEYVEDRAFNDRRYAVDSNKLEQLGWKPSISWEEGLDRTIAWYKKHSDKWWGDIEHVLVPHPARVVPKYSATMLRRSNSVKPLNGV